MSLYVDMILPELRGEIVTRLPSVLDYAFTCKMAYGDVQAKELLPSQSIPSQWRRVLVATTDKTVPRTVRLATQFGLCAGELGPNIDLPPNVKNHLGVWIHYSQLRSYHFTWFDYTRVDDIVPGCLEILQCDETEGTGPKITRIFTMFADGRYCDEFEQQDVDWIRAAMTRVDCTHCRDTRH